MACGGGTRTNYRTSKASAAHGEVQCKEETISIEEGCNLHHCPGKSPPVIRDCTFTYFKIFDCVALMW